MIGILGGMGTQAGLDLCNKLSMLYRGKSDQEYPKFILYNKSYIPKRPENLKKYYNVLNELVKGCKLLQKNKCKFIVIPCNTAHYWYDDLKKKIKIPILSMPEQAFLYSKKNCKSDSKIGLLSTEATIKTKVYNKYFNNNFFLVHPTKVVQKKYVNAAIKLVKQGKVKEASKAIQPAITYFKRIRCDKIILGCTELPVAVFAFKSYKFAKESKIFIDPNLILAEVCKTKYKSI
jgi:aspartate racemase